MESPESFFAEMSRLEKQYAERLREAAPKTSNIVVRTIMEAVAQDSYKHALIYEALSRMVSGGKEPPISEEEAYEIRREIEDHIHTEAEMIRRVEEMLDKGVGDKAVEFLLQTILRDEVFHHAVLKKVEEAIVTKEVMRDTDWDLVWRDSVSHRIPYIYSPAHRKQG